MTWLVLYLYMLVWPDYYCSMIWVVLYQYICYCSTLGALSSYHSCEIFIMPHLQCCLLHSCQIVLVPNLQCCHFLSTIVFGQFEIPATGSDLFARNTTCHNVKFDSKPLFQYWPPKSMIGQRRVCESHFTLLATSLWQRSNFAHWSVLDQHSVTVTYNANPIWIDMLISVNASSARCYQ